MKGQRFALSLCGFAAAVVIAQLVGEYRVLGDGWPPLSQVIGYLGDPQTGSPVFSALGRTFVEAGEGFVLGTLAAVGLACLGLVLPPLQPGIDRFAVIVNSVPLIALGPILVTTVGPNASPLVIATMSAGFVVFVAATSGLTSVSPTLLAVFDAMGSSKAKRVARLNFPHAVPLLIDGLCLAAPAAVLGAILGEWFGAEQGIGVVLIGAMQNYNVDELWAAALLASAASLTAYLALTQLRTVARRRFT
jgi:NitT/TauT family transport system permease protein